MSLDKEHNAKTPEELAREAAAQQAMMDDLGIARMDELPVDDGELEEMKAANERKKGGKGGKKNGRPDHVDHQPRYEPRRAQIQSAALVARSAHMANVWKDAIASGAFDDDVAAEVKALDDLGGARLHDRNRDQIKADANLRTKTLLQYQQKHLHSYEMHGNTSQAKKQRYSHEQIDQAFKSKAPFGGHQNQNQNAPSSNRAAAAPSRSSSNYVVPSRSASRAVQGQPKAIQGPPRVVQEAPRTNLIPPSQYGGNQHIADPPNMVARIEVLVTPPGKKNPMQSIVFLTVAGAPILGFCMMFVENKLFVQFTIAEYQDFMSSDLTLSLYFGENVQFFSLTFRTAAELESFLEILRDIKAGKYVVEAAGSSAQKPSPETSVALEKAAPTRTAPKKSVVRLPAPAAQVVAPAPKAVQHAARMLTGEVSSRRQPGDQKEAQSTQGVLINLDGNDANPAKERRSLGTSALLSTLQPYGNHDTEATTPIQNSVAEEVSALAPYENISRASTPAQNGAVTLEPSRLSVPGAVAMLRNILAAFIIKKAGGKNKQELAATVDGIREAFVDVVCQDHTESEKQEIVAQIEDYLNSSAAESGEHRHVQYTNEEMFGMINNQIQPPAWLSDLPYLPPRTGSRQVPRLEDPLYTPPVDDVATKEHIRKSTMGMDWVLGKTESSPPTPPEQPVAVSKAESSVPRPFEKPAVEKAKKNTPMQASSTNPQPVQATVKAKTGPHKPDFGLWASRWSSGMAAPIQNSNAFTGLPYENRWKKGSYLYDLAQLDPQAKIDAPVDDLVDYFFPTSQVDGEAGALSSFQMQNGNATLQSSASDLSSDTQMGELGRKMSRLTLKSPSGSRATSCSSVQREPIDQVPQLIPIEEDPATPTLNAAARTFTPTARASTPTMSTPPPANTNTPSSTSTLCGLGASRHASRAAPPTAGQFNFHLPRFPRE